MAESREAAELFWLDPEQRGVLPLDGFHIPRRLARTVRSERFDVRIDTAFEHVMRACAAPRPGSEESWINEEIISLYCALFRKGYAHSVECWRESRLVGGVYGVHIGAAFFGESMFSAQRDASKVALVHLVARLCAGGFKLLDTQFVTPHLSGFGVIEIPRGLYHRLLRGAVNSSADFYSLPERCSGVEVLQSITQIS